MKKLGDSSWRGALRYRPLAALVISGALALGTTLARWPRGVADDVGRFERALLPLRGALRPGNRVALLVRDETLDALFRTQYVLAPVIVVRARVADCTGPTASSACLRGADHLLVSEVTLDEAAELGEPLGLAPVAEFGGRVLLARKPR